MKLLENPECQREAEWCEGGCPSGAVAFSGGMQPVHGDLLVGESWGNKCSDFLLCFLISCHLSSWPNPKRSQRTGIYFRPDSRAQKKSQKGPEWIWEANERCPAQLHCWLTPGEGRFCSPTVCGKNWHTRATSYLTTAGVKKSSCLVSRGRACFLPQSVHRRRQWLLLRALPCAHPLHLSAEALFTDLRKASIGFQWFPNITK